MLDGLNVRFNDAFNIYLAISDVKAAKYRKQDVLNPDALSSENVLRPSLCVLSFISDEPGFPKDD